MNTTKLLNLVKEELDSEDDYGCVMDVFTDAFYSNQHVSKMLKTLTPDQGKTLTMKLFEKYSDDIDLHGILQWGVSDTCVRDGMHEVITRNSEKVIQLITEVAES